MAERRGQPSLALVLEEETQADVEDEAHRLERSPTQADALEATELERLRKNYSRASASRRSGSSTMARKPVNLLERFAFNVKKAWKHQVSITVEHSTCRDHLALERTFLGYLRTSLALSMMGITVAQLFRLQHAPVPNLHFGFFVLGKPLACICQGAAIYTLMIGCFRTWRSQNAMVRGKAISGGYEIVALAVGIFLLLVMFFVILVAVDVLKEDVT